MAGGLHNSGRGRRGRVRRAPMAEINVTPMVDVMLVLLVIFMVTAPLLKAGIPLTLPDSHAHPLDQQPHAVTISLTRDGRAFLDDAELPREELAHRVAALNTMGPPGADGQPVLVTLRADKGLDYGSVVAVMGDLNRAGISHISLVTGSGGAPAAALSAGSVKRR